MSRALSSLRARAGNPGALVALGALSLGLSACGPASDPAAEAIGTVVEPVTVCPSGNVIHGVDVSHWDGSINWSQAHGDGIDFTIAKATEAADYTDDTFAANRQNAEAAGVVFGAYHFFRANVDPTEQANYFLGVIGSVEAGEISPTLDLETTDGMGASTIASRAATFLQVVQQQTGRVPMLYTSPSFYTGTLGAPASLAPYLLWIANWEVNCPDVPSAWSDWTVWQSADNGTVAGIPTTNNTDLDEFDGTVEELQCAGVQCASGTCVAGVCTGGGGSGGAGGTGATGGAGGTTHTGGHHVDAGTGANDQTVPSDDSSGGCKCHASPAGSSPRALVLAALAALCPFARRRRRSSRA
jgi:lysozyme